MEDLISIFDLMQKGRRSGLLPRVDYITILIILVFLAMAFGVFLYYKDRIQTIQHQLRQTSYCLQEELKDRPNTLSMM